MHLPATAADCRPAGRRRKVGDAHLAQPGAGYGGSPGNAPVLPATHCVSAARNVGPTPYDAGGARGDGPCVGYASAALPAGTKWWCRASLSPTSPLVTRPARQRLDIVRQNQQACAGIAPRVLDWDDGCFREEFVAIRRLRRNHTAVSRAAAAVRSDATCESRTIGSLVDDWLDRPQAHGAIRQEVARCLKEVGGVAVPVGLVHGDLLPRNLFRRGDGALVALDWEFSRRAPATYDFWHEHFWCWIEGKITRSEWRAAFAKSLRKYAPETASFAEAHDAANILSTYAFFAGKSNGAHAPVKVAAARQLLHGATVYVP